MSRLIARAQDQVAILLGLEPSRRTPLVRSMLHRPHLGAPLGLAGIETLAKAVALDGALPVIDEVTLETVRVDERGLSVWLQRAVALIAHASELATVRFCVTTPPPPTNRKRVDPAAELATAVLREYGAAASNIVVRTGAAWQVEPRLDACPELAP
jgi:hypothetical protein